jgi:hypothetical protein
MPETRVISLRGRLREFGPRIEHAPAGLIYVGRRLNLSRWRSWDLPQSDWANPISVKDAGGAESAVEQYASWMARPEQAGLRARIVSLQGAELGCWCDVAKGAPCHASRLAAWADYGFPGDGAFDLLDRWIDFKGCVDDPKPPQRPVETVTGAGRWAAAL